MTPTESSELVRTQAVPEGTKAITKYTAEHGREIGMPSPEAVNYMMSVANLLSRSALITPDMGNDPDQIKANAMAKMLVGFEMGIGGLQALQSIDIVKGRIFVRYPQLIAQMLRKGFKLEWRERSVTRAALFVEPPAGYPMMAEEFEFTIEDAKKAGLVRDGSQYSIRPRVMLSARVVSEAYRMTGGHSGIYTPEEREEITGEPTQERGDASDRAFQEQARRNGAAAEEQNPFKVGEKPKPEAAAGQSTQPAPAATESATESVQSGQTKPEPAATEAPKTEKLRGRRAAAQPEAAPPPQTAATATDAPAAQTAATPAPAANGAYKATDDDVPAGIGTAKPGPQLVQPSPEVKAAHAQATNASDPQANRLTALTVALATAGKRSPDEAKKRVLEFIRGFLNVTKAPQVPDEKYNPMLPLLESIVSLLPTKLLADPHTMGIEARAGWEGFVRYVDQWEPELKAAATIATITHYPDRADDLVAFLDDFIKIGEMTPAEQLVFLKAFRITKESASKLRERSIADGKPMAEILAGLDLNTASEADILSRIASGGPVQTGQTAEQPKEPGLWD